MWIHPRLITNARILPHSQWFHCYFNFPLSKYQPALTQESWSLQTQSKGGVFTLLWKPSWMPALDEKFSLEEKESLFPGCSGNDPNLPVPYFHLTHQSCLRTLQTARVSSSSHAAQQSPPLSCCSLTNCSASHTLPPDSRPQLISTETSKTCLQTQRGLMFVFLKSDFLTLLPPASTTME